MNVWYISDYASMILRKDKLFYPFIVAVLLLFIFAFSAGEWSIGEAERVLMDLTALALHIFGSLITVIWGAQLFRTFPAENPSIESELLAPVSRSEWILGNFLGLARQLGFCLTIFFLFWTALFLYQGFFTFSWPLAWMFFSHFLGWLCLAAISSLLGTLCRHNLAILTSLTLWISALLAPLSHLSPGGADKPGLLAQLWNFQRFNQVAYDLTEPGICFHTCLYALGLITLFLALACLSFENRRLHRF